MSNSTKTILLCGVGGQGTILAAHILADVALNSGLDVKVSEIHGMSQRGGSVTTVVRFGDSVNSMVCDPGSADLVVAFEAIEALRNIEMLSMTGEMIVSDEIINPTSVLTGKFNLDFNPINRVLDTGALLVPAISVAREIGNTKVANTVILGALAYLCDFDFDTWTSCISKHVPQKTIDANLEAFKAGFEFAKEHRA